MSLLFLFSCAIFTIQLSNGALSWYLENCELFYNRADSNAVGTIEPVQTSCAAVPKMPCNCATVPFVNKLYNEPADPSNTFELTGNSYIEGVVTINRPSPDDYYQLSGFTFAWEVANQPVFADPTLSYVQVLDANENTWEDVATLHNWNGVLLTAQNLTWMDCNPSSLMQWTTYQVRFRLEWNASATFIYPAYIEITGLAATKKPTTAPTEVPSVSPTKNPTVNPTKNPTRSPTSAPTTPPTAAPSASPTFTIVQRKTKQLPGVDDFFTYSDNIIPLSSRDNGNMTYRNYRLPDLLKPNGQIQPGEERPYCVTCILAWADIDANIELEGCPNTTYNYSSTNPNDPNSIYHCHNGTWVLTTSGRLADWQETYGRLEIWEVDDRGVTWLHSIFEFNWWNDTCSMKTIINDDPETPEVATIDCPVLPLTGTQQYAAFFEFTMPKKYGDSRTAPLVAVWYDILSIPYAIKPELDYKYLNFSLYVPTQGPNFGLQDAMGLFRPAIIAAGILFACFLAVMILSCFVSGDKKSKKDFMIDTRNLKTTFRHTPETIIVPPSEIENRARFSCARHGPWLLVVLVARLIYMFVFTFTFFGTVFTILNKKQWDTLGQYDLFAVGRDAQLVEYSHAIERHYANETDRMATELEFRQTWCNEAYHNKTIVRYTTGGKDQVNYHNHQINNPMGNFSVNFTTSKSIYVLGDGQTACNIDGDGGIIWLNSATDPSIIYLPHITQQRVDITTVVNATFNRTVSYLIGDHAFIVDNVTVSIYDPATNISTLYPATTYSTVMAGNLTQLDARDYDTSFSNFSFLENTIGSICQEATWCYGWGFANRDGATAPYYVMFNEMADPAVQEGVSGICYGASKLDDELALLTFNFSFFDNYADTLNAQYLEDFQSYADDMYDSLSGIWSAIQDFNPKDGFPIGTTGFEMFLTTQKNLTKEAGYSLGFEPGEPVYNDSVCPTACYEFFLNVNCKSCPAGDFSNQSLKSITAYLFNESNITDYNASNIRVNFSNLVDINTAFIEFPDLPTIELPFDFDIPIDLSFLTTLCLSLDFLLFIYRWYRTTGIVARIVRGKDVDVGLSYLMVNQSKPRCCYGRSIMDYCLNAVIYCHDFLFRLGYNAWMIFYWVWFLLRIAIVGLLVFMLYWLVDAILTVEFIEGIGTFQLMTVGLGAQRSVRNQVICSTALGYNNYTLTNMDEAIGDFAQERNDDAWQQNLLELQRVENFNQLFCRGWVAYQTASRDVTAGSVNKAWVDLSTITVPDEIDWAKAQGTYFTYNVSSAGAMDTADIGNLFDDDPTTYWRPYTNADANNSAPVGQDIIFDFYLSKIYMTSDVNDSTWWDIVQISFDLRFEYDANNKPLDAVTPISFQVFVDANNTGVLSEIVYPNSNEYEPGVAAGARQTAARAIKMFTIAQEINTRRIRVVLQNVANWGTEYYLNGLSFAGHAPESKVVCPEVKFRFWQFDASPTSNENASAYIMDTPSAKNPDATTYYDGDGTYIEYCPQITPIHGYMYRGFVRTWLNEQLIIGHEPFILALRNIALSPFYIAIVLIGVLFIAYLFAFIMEWFLMKLDLFRENPYAKVPLVTTSYDKYDTDLHETAGDHGTIYGTASVGKDYYRPTTSKEEEESTGNLLGNKHVDRNEIEMGLSSQVTVRGKNKKKVPGEAAGDTYKAPEEEEYAEYDC